MKRNEKLHLQIHQKQTNNYIPTVQEVIKYIDCWLEYHNSKPCPNDRSRSIQEMLDSIQRQDINKSALDYLMMKTEGRTINKHGITFLNMHYRSEAILGLRDKIYIRYSLFDLSKVYVYSAKGEFLCVAHRVQKVHPMARILGTVKDMEEYNQQYKKQQQIKNRLIKKVKAFYQTEDISLLEIKPEVIDEIAPILEEKPKREQKKTPREQQMMRPIFANDAEKYEWLIAHGCTNQEDRQFLTKFMQSEQYQLLYGD